MIAADPRFKAATSGAGVSNVLGMYGHDQYVVQYDLELGQPWKVEPGGHRADRLSGGDPRDPAAELSEGPAGPVRKMVCQVSGWGAGAVR